jgi:hypothetical protein
VESRGVRGEEVEETASSWSTDAAATRERETAAATDAAVCCWKQAESREWSRAAAVRGAVVKVDETADVDEAAAVRVFVCSASAMMTSDERDVL